MSLLSHALTSVARLAAFRQADVPAASSSEEALYQNIINSVSDYIESYTGRRLIQTTYTQEEYNGTGSQYIVLKNYPVDTDAGVTVERRNSAVNDDDWQTIDSRYYFVNAASGIIEGANENIGWRKGTNNYRVTYTAGYDFDLSTTFLSDFAADLEFIVWSLADTALTNITTNATNTTGIASEKLGDYSVTYTSTVMKNSEMQSVLDKYVKHGVDSYDTPTNI